jgi:hypothetical protein
LQRVELTPGGIGGRDRVRFAPAAGRELEKVGAGGTGPVEDAGIESGRRGARAQQARREPGRGEANQRGTKTAMGATGDDDLLEK